MKLPNVASFFIITISVVITLIYGQSLIVPFILGVLLWFIMRKIKSLLDRIDFVKRNFPSWLKSLFASVLILSILSIAANILSYNISALAKSYPKYESNVELIINQLNKVFHIDLIEAVKAQSGNFDFGAVLGAIFSSLSGILGNAFMIIIYSIFVLFEETNFQSKLDVLFTDKSKYQRFNQTIKKIENSISSYLGLKTLVSLVTGGLSFIALLLIGIDSPAFWAFLIFILNFIPTIGSLIATCFPAIFCLLQFGDFTPALLVLVVVGAIQLLVGNVLEPRLMGSSMNISPLVTIIALSLWGAIWGVTGMILSIPITVIMLIIFAEFEPTRPVAIMLSEKGILSMKDKA